MYYSYRLVRYSLYLLAIIFIAFYSLPAAAQGKQSIVKLWSGEKVKGTIITAIPDEYIVMVTGDDSNRKILASDIVDIDGEPLKKQPPSRLSIIAGLFAGYDLISGLQYTVINPNIIIGVRFKRHWRVGGGLGFLYAHANNFPQPVVQYGNISSLSLENLSYLPIFANLHCEFGKKKIMPSLDISLGYPININGNHIYNTELDPNLGLNDNYFLSQQGIFYGLFSPGVSFRVAKSISINVAATFNLLVIKELNQMNVATEYGSTTTLNSDRQLCGAVGGSINIIY